MGKAQMRHVYVREARVTQERSERRTHVCRSCVEKAGPQKFNLQLILANLPLLVTRSMSLPSSMYDSHLHTMFAREPLPLSSLTTWHLSAMCASAAVCSVCSAPILLRLLRLLLFRRAFLRLDQSQDTEESCDQFVARVAELQRNALRSNDDCGQPYKPLRTKNCEHPFPILIIIIKTYIKLMEYSVIQ